MNTPASSPPATRPPLSIRRAAVELNVSTRTISRWIKSGRLKSVRMGKLHRIPPEVIERTLRDGVPLD